MADYSFFIYQGEHKTMQVRAWRLDNNEPLDLTTATIEVNVRVRVGGDMVFQKSSANPSEAAVTDPVGGVAEVYFVPADTLPPLPDEPLEPACYSYDVWALGVGAPPEDIVLVPPSALDVRASHREQSS